MLLRRSLPQDASRDSAESAISTLDPRIDTLFVDLIISAPFVSEVRKRTVESLNENAEPVDDLLPVSLNPAVSSFDLLSKVVKDFDESERMRESPRGRHPYLAWYDPIAPVARSVPAACRRSCDTRPSCLLKGIAARYSAWDDSDDAVWSNRHSNQRPPNGHVDLVVGTVHVHLAEQD